MYSPKQTLIDSFIVYIQSSYQTVFGTQQSNYEVLLGDVASKVLGTIAQSDALYHDLEHTILVTSVGQEILQAKRACDGVASVKSEDWVHFIIALLCHDIGYCRGICRQDDCELGRHSTGVGEEFIFLPFGATDAALSKYHVDRSQQFVQEQFEQEPLIDVVRVQQIIDRTRFPAKPGSLAMDIQELANLGRSADLIGQFSDRNYLQKLPALFYEFEQSGVNDSLGYRQIKDVRLGLPEFYWNSVHSYVENALSYLNHTPTGQQIVMELRANISGEKAHL